MKNNKKYIGVFIIILSLMISGVALAEENTVSSVMDTIKGKNGEVKKVNSEYKVKIGNIIKEAQKEREEFKKNAELNKEEVKQKILLLKEEYKIELAKIKDESKKTSAEKIIESLQELNTRLTNQLSEKVDQIENVLISIESRASKTEEKGADISAVNTSIEKAKTAIATARKAISDQTKKVYSKINITDDQSLKTEIIGLRDTFKNDIKTVRNTVVAAHMAVKEAATTLAQIPGVNNDDGKNSPKAEDSVGVKLINN